MAKNNIVPLLILFIVVGILAVVGFVVYTIVQDISNKTREKMEKKNVLFTKDGMKVGVKELKDEDYKDRSQSVLVNVWNHTSFPGYKSRLWDTGAEPSGKNNKKLEKRKPHAQ